MDTSNKTKRKRETNEDNYVYIYIYIYVEWCMTRLKESSNLLLLKRFHIVEINTYCNSTSIPLTTDQIGFVPFMCGDS